MKRNEPKFVAVAAPNSWSEDGSGCGQLEVELHCRRRARSTQPSRVVHRCVPKSTHPLSSARASTTCSNTQHPFLHTRETAKAQHTKIYIYILLYIHTKLYTPIRIYHLKPAINSNKVYGRVAHAHTFTPFEFIALYRREGKSLARLVVAAVTDELAPVALECFTIQRLDQDIGHEFKGGEGVCVRYATIHFV